MCQAGAGFVARQYHRLERFQREVAQPWILKHRCRAQKRRDHVGVSIDVHRSIDGPRHRRLAVIETALALVGEGALDPSHQLGTAVPILVRLQPAPRIQKQIQQRGVVFQRFLSARLAPIAVFGVAIETAVVRIP